ncbi:MAG TPA: hypothetical protein VK826_12450 [Bacteroidia bacterium]|nr:hypothetical protein [Bacteroidia bacterium]
MKKIVLFIFIFLSAANLRSQDFDYTVSTDSVAWNELSAQTILNTGNSAWSFSYKIPIGFTFNYLGRNFDSLTIETNGYIVFDEDRNYALTAFSGVGDCVDSEGNHAIIGYELSGTVGNRILKIQYKNCGLSGSSSETQSWQIWLRENGNVEVRIGPGTLRTNEIGVLVVNEETFEESFSTILVIDTEQNCRIGLLNMNMDTEVRGLFIGSSCTSPQTRAVNEEYPETLYLDSVPNRGFRYTFTPSN